MPAYFTESAPRSSSKPAPLPKKSQKRIARELAEHGRVLPTTTRKSAKPIAKRSKKRRADDARIYGPQEFRDDLHRHACLGCGYRGMQIEQAHVHTGGVGRKDDWTRTGPLCGPHYECVEGGGWALVEGCHAQYDAAKRSWRTHDGLTFSASQKRFFSKWEKSQFSARHALFVKKLRRIP